MTSKKVPSGKRAALPRPSDRTKAFAKDWTRLSHSGRYDMRRLKEVMLLLIANDSPLGPEWLDHPLRGDWADHQVSRRWGLPLDLSPRRQRRGRADRCDGRAVPIGRNIRVPISFGLLSDRL